MPTGRWADLDPELVAPEVSTRLVVPFVAHMERLRGTDFCALLLEDCGLPRDYLVDQDQWVSSLWLERFCRAWMRRAHGLSELPEIDHPGWALWRDVGRQTWTREALGPAYSLVRAMGSPGTLYARLSQISGRGNRVMRIEAVDRRVGRVTMVMAPTDPGAGPVRADTVWNLCGLFEALPTVWNLPRARVDFAPDPSGTGWRYEVHFAERSLSAPLALVAGSLAAGAAMAILGALLGGSVGAVLGALVGTLAVAAAMGWWRVRALQDALLKEADQLGEVLARHDERAGLLHAEGQALRRALVASRKLSGYLASDLVERIIEEPELELELGGKRTEAAVLFADIVGFTPRCEPMAPEAVVDELNLYFAHVDPAFAAHGGIIDKRMGDGIMAVFVPRPGEPREGLHARAVGCGLDMLRALDTCNAALAALDADPLEIRVGVAAGTLVQGNMGSPVKLEYTVVGDTVNLAARLEGEAQPGKLLLMAQALPAPGPETGPFEVSTGRTIHVKGKTRSVDVVELLPLPRPGPDVAR